jgi:hypothetical protein
MGKRTMIEKNLILPFVAKTPNMQEDISFQAELACVVCMAESQRKKPSFMRDSSEKIAYISKVYYPMWVLSADNACLVIDGLSNSAHEFAFDEPTKTAALIEELKKNSLNPQKFAEALKSQAREIKEFSKPVKISFPGVVDDRELRGFLPEYFKSGTLHSGYSEETAAIPSETDSKGAAQTAKALVNCLRTIQADAKGLKYALAVLKEELEFHSNAANNEIEHLQEKLDTETAALKPAVDKAVKKLTQKQDKSLATLQRNLERKMGGLDKKRERYMHKLGIAEQRRDAVQSKIDAAKKRKKPSKSSSGSFALKKYEREVDTTKNEIKAISDEFDKVKKDGESSLKQKREEFQKVIAQEENRLIQLSRAYGERMGEKQMQIEDMSIQAAAITTSLENRVDELKRNGNALQSQVEVNWKMDYPEEPVLAKLPVYLVKYSKGEEERYNLLSPIAFSEDASVLNGLKKMLALNPEPKLKTLTHPVSKRLHETLSVNLLGKTQIDAAFRMKLNEVCRASNLLDLNTFGQILNEGLDEIEKKGWMTHEEAAVFCKRVMRDEA